MMMKATHIEARPTATRAISTPETSSLSAVVSRKLPSVVVCFQRLARRPSKKSVIAAIANRAAAAGVAHDTRVAHRDQGHHHGRERDPQVGDGREERGGSVVGGAHRASGAS